jgi:hypothetical protein
LPLPEKGRFVFEQMIISMLLGVIHTAVKNPASAAQLENALLGVRDSINLLYPGK